MFNIYRKPANQYEAPLHICQTKAEAILWCNSQGDYENENWRWEDDFKIEKYPKAILEPNKIEGGRRKPKSVK